ncbi:ParB-like nuclease domain-containing protein [Bacteroides gallinaceum]|uniref:IbrB-like domain-containing protein n=1 Tax=Bacteroides gallinaceum TaxID=1462571 RepID=UPI00195C0AEC|nr:ParB/RepB/Spo0J family partition protein [Bacteroides gallinaceum]MBM6718248.1 ParB-like nuclease domain-containing protein [Bacteroides gallinaceum]
MRKKKEQLEEPIPQNYKSPAYNVIAVPVEKVHANDYNPNKVAPPEMKLLELSIWEDGFTMPCVCYYDHEKDEYILVDGFHRYSVLKKSKRIYEREKGMLPVVIIDKDLSNRIGSTIRHNRARGTHDVDLMSHIVSELDKAGMSDQWIMKNIGMDRDELLRLKQISGLAELFIDKNFTIPPAKPTYLPDPENTEENAVKSEIEK